MGQLYIPTHEKIAAEVRTYVFDFSKFSELLNGETLVTPTAPVVSGLTFGSPGILASELDGVPANKGVTVTISGGTANANYVVECRCTTSGGATLARRMNLLVK